jgi:hemolysin activation/secretion protein
MLVGNIEYLFVPGFMSDELTLSLFADGGWTNTFGSDAFSLDDVFPSAGIGASLIDQSIRLELAWPLDTDRAGTNQPSLWLRLARSF